MSSQGLSQRTLRTQQKSTPILCIIYNINVRMWLPRFIKVSTTMFVIGKYINVLAGSLAEDPAHPTKVNTNTLHNL
jgi:hypothetical protein